MLTKGEIKQRILHKLRTYLEDPSYEPKPGSIDEWLIEILSELDQQIYTYVLNLYMEQSPYTAKKKSSLMKLAKLYNIDIDKIQPILVKLRVSINLDNIEDTYTIDENISFLINNIPFTPIHEYTISKVDDIIVVYKHTETKRENIDFTIVARNIGNKVNKLLEFEIECFIGTYQQIETVVNQSHTYGAFCYIEIPKNENEELMIESVNINQQRCIYEPYIFGFTNKDQYYYTIDYNNDKILIQFSNGLYGKLVKPGDKVTLELKRIRTDVNVNKINRIKSHKVYKGVTLEAEIIDIEHPKFETKESLRHRIINTQHTLLITENDFEEFLRSKYNSIIRKVSLAENKLKLSLKDIRVSHNKKQDYVQLSRIKNGRHIVPILNVNPIIENIYETASKYYCKLISISIDYDITKVVHMVTLTIHTNLFGLTFEITNNEKIVPKRLTDIRKDKDVITIKFPIEEGKVSLTAIMGNTKFFAIDFKTGNLHVPLDFVERKIYVHKDDVSQQFVDFLCDIHNDFKKHCLIGHIPIIEFSESEVMIDDKIPIPLRIKIDAFDESVSDSVLINCTKQAVDALNDTHVISNTILTHLVHRCLKDKFDVDRVVCECYILDKDGQVVQNKFNVKDIFIHTKDELIEIERDSEV